MQEPGFLDKMIGELKTKGTRREAEAYLMQQLSPAQSKKLKEVLSDENAARAMLQTPQAQSLLKKLMGEDADGREQHP